MLFWKKYFVAKDKVDCGFKILNLGVGLMAFFDLSHVDALILF